MHAARWLGWLKIESKSVYFNILLTSYPLGDIFFLTFAENPILFPFMQIIGVTGNAKVGKDEFVKHSIRLLQDKYGLKAVRIAFADSLKHDLFELIRDSFGLDIFTLPPDKKEIIRPLMVSYGATARALHPDFWIKRLDDEIEAQKKIGDGKIFSKFDENYPVDVIFISDVRYQNEVDWIKKQQKGEVIGVRKIIGESKFDPNLYLPVQTIYQPPANQEEAEYTAPLLHNISSKQTLTWPHVGDDKLNE